MATQQRFLAIIAAMTTAMTIPAAPVFAGECALPEGQPSIYDLGADLYKTFDGGFYAGGINERPPAHEAAGVAIADALVPLDAAGDPAADGAVVMISIGYSNMTQEWASGAVGDPASQALTFRAKAETLQADGVVNPALRIVDGAIGGTPAWMWAQTPGPGVFPWIVPVDRLGSAGLTRFQVQVAVVKTSSASPTECIADDGSTVGMAGETTAHFGDIAQNLRLAFPNVKLVYFVSRSYGGYALTGLMPEPFAFEQGYAIKWIVDAQINASNAYGDLTFTGPGAAAPWLSYGPYLWANGETPNGQGLSWSIDDFRPDDRTHPAAGAIDKAGDTFLEFFMADSTTRPWFLSHAALCPADFDGNGVISFPDLLQLLAAWGPCESCPMDIDGDGAVAFGDLLALLSTWGPCE